MAIGINTNVASLNAQRSLGKTQGMLDRSLSRLASGLRINSSKDDAAGLAISDRMTAQIRGMNQAARNAQDAISLTQTADGAAAEMTNTLQRMREIAVQSRNSTNTPADRASLDSEFQELLSELDRTASTAAFNGQKVLDGSLGTSVFQVGANVGETIDVTLSTSLRTNAIGNFATTTLTIANGAGTTDDNGNARTNYADALNAVANEIQINGTNIGAAANGANGQGDGSAKSIAEAINLLSTTHGVTATAQTTTATITSSNFASALAFTDNGTGDTLAYALEINDQLITTQTEGSLTITTQSDLVQAINAQSTTTGVTAKLESNSDITLTAADGRNIEVVEEVSGSTAADDDIVTGFFGDNVNTAATNTVGSFANTFKAQIKLEAEVNISVTDANGGETGIFSGIADNTTSTTQISALIQSNVLTASASDDAINRIDVAINDIGSYRSTFGATQSRFETAISSLQVITENLSASRSRILDADFAAETASLTKFQVLQQAGISILGQANSAPQIALSLLQ